MTIFEQFIAIYFISIAAIAGLAVLWRNWLEDHEGWKTWLQRRLAWIGHALTCGSCFTYWVALLFVLPVDPLGAQLASLSPFAHLPWAINMFIQWMAFGWGAVFLRFSYVAIQETVSIMVHRHDQVHTH